MAEHSEPTPLLDLKTLVERPTIAIDGELYEILSPDELSIVDCHRFAAWGNRIDALMAKKALTKSEKKELGKILGDLSDKIMAGVPEALRAKLKKKGFPEGLGAHQLHPQGKLIKDYDLSGFRSLFLAGERADPDTLLWAEKNLGVPVIVHTDSKSRLALEALHLLSEAGADLSKVSICHLDSGFFEDQYYEDILKTGARIELDTFGENFCLHPNYGP
ncbi:hypothetical protein LCGC14_2968830, partial [marine sediment metagenome]